MNGHHILSDEPHTVAYLQAENACLRQRIADLEAKLTSWQRADQPVRGHRALFDEIVERRRTEEAYHTLVEHSLQGMVILQHERIVFANPMMSTITGYTLEELYAFTCESDPPLLHPDDQPLIYGYLQDRIAGRPTPTSYEHRILHKDGTVRCVEASAVLASYRGQPAVQATYIDVTERKEAEERLQFQSLMLDSIGQAVIASDMDGTVIYWNRAAETIYGWTAAEALGRHVVEVTTAESARPVSQEAMPRLSRGETWSGEFVACYRHERTFPAFVTTVPIHDDHGVLVGLIGISTDISERKQMEEALRKSEQRFRVIFERAAMGLVLADSTGSVQEANPAFQQLLGYSYEELHGMSYVVMSHPDDLPLEQPLAAEVVAGHKTSYELEKRYIRKDGSIFWGHLSVSLIRDEAGEPAFGVSIVQDITERREMETALRESEARYRTLVETSPDAVLLTDRDGTIRFCNQQATTLFGYAGVEELSGQNSTILVAPPVSHIEHVGLVARSGSVRNIEYTMRCKDGRTFPAEISMSVVSDASNMPQSLIVVVRDISRRKLLQTRMIENERFVASGKLVASVAHEINTPLQAIQSSLSLLDKVATPEEYARFLSNAKVEIQRIGTIVHQLLDLYRPGKDSYDYVQIGTMLEHILLLMGKPLKDAGVGLVCQVAESLPPVWGCAAELTQVFFNLLSNAIEAMPDGGSLTVQVQMDGQEDGEGTTRGGSARLVINIRDTGCGIPAEMHLGIFEPFVTTKCSGTGQGLTICRHIVRQHGGTIMVDSRPGAGSTFTVALPVSAH